ncbi:UPF0746 protein DDB_G0281095-like [Corticium candelabrum]|uniref:UPF0746 protein DDB_G0281095-like n=1 Tax=Corticium candelabrum TaxID=121492 RepID=UPI002E253008|nr:UPF0746 protein DDB_G0281095-like [Corticium candelabrum]
MSTLHAGHHHTLCTRYTKDHVKYDGCCRITISRPEAISDYNSHMGGVDKSDQMIKYYEVLHKSLKYWKKIFLHMIDLVVFNSYIMFTALQEQHPQDERLKRRGQYRQKDFRCELIRGLAGIDLHEPVPQFCSTTKRIVQVQPQQHQQQHQQLLEQVQQLQKQQEQMQQQEIQQQQQLQRMQQQQQQQVQIQQQQMRHVLEQQQIQHQQQMQLQQQQMQRQQQQIQQQLLQQLLRQEQQLRQQHQPPPSPQQQQDPHEQPNPRYSSHLPIVTERLVRCIVCYSEDRKHTKTRYRYQECNVPLCVSSAERQCFCTYHS